jgi:hypothetical protein
VLVAKNLGQEPLHRQEATFERAGHPIALTLGASPSAPCRD